MEGNIAEIELPFGKELAKSIFVVSIFTIFVNFYAIYRIYKRRSQGLSSTSIIVCNLAFIDVLVTGKDSINFLNVGLTGKWTFIDSWCSSYGLTSVIFIIISVSTLVTISSERFSRLKEIAFLGLQQISSQKNNSSNPLVLGYVIAHTTLSYSLSLLWSKYIFITRKAFCRVEWPPQYGFSTTFLSSIVFVLPVSALVYNTFFRTLKPKQYGIINQQNQLLLQPTKTEVSDHYNNKAQEQLHISVAIFLCSWSPYVVESLLSSAILIHPNIGIAVACIPIFMTSLLPLFYVCCEIPEIKILKHQEKDFRIVIQ